MPQKKKRTKKTKAVKKRAPKRSKARKIKPAKKKRASNKLDFHNQRQHPRVPMRLKIDYFKDPGVFLYDYSRNLGRGGLFIETTNPLAPGTEIHLSFVLPEQNETVELSGKVVWIYQGEAGKPMRGIPGMGIQFLNPEGKNKDALDRFFREIDYDNLAF